LELLWQWHDFNFPDEDLPQATKPRVVEPDKGLPFVQQAPSASADPARPLSSRDLVLEIGLTQPRCVY